jgi:Flp pilus assembly protein TadG
MTLKIGETLLKKRNNDGMTSLEFLITSFLFFFLVFASVDYFITLMQYQIVQHISTYYLERIRINGRLSTADENEMKNRLSSIGLTLESMTGNNFNRQSQGQPPITRNIDNPDQSKITVTFTIKPDKKPFIAGSLVGGNSGASNFRFKVGGTVLSEYI